MLLARPDGRVQTSMPCILRNEAHLDGDRESSTRRAMKTTSESSRSYSHPERPTTPGVPFGVGSENVVREILHAGAPLGPSTQTSGPFETWVAFRAGRMTIGSRTGSRRLLWKMIMIT